MRRILITLFAFFGALSISAIEHNFNDMLLATEIAFSNSNKTGTTDLTTYNCSGSAVFGQDLINPAGYKKISINMPNSTSVMTTSVAIEYLTGFMLQCYPTSTISNIQVYVSETGVFGDPVPSANITRASTGTIDVKLPKGTYYIKLTNTTSTAVSIYQINYYQMPCNCFPVTE